MNTLLQPSPILFVFHQYVSLVLAAAIWTREVRFDQKYSQGWIWFRLINHCSRHVLKCFPTGLQRYLLWIWFWWPGWWQFRSSGEFEIRVGWIGRWVGLGTNKKDRVIFLFFWLIIKLILFFFFDFLTKKYKNYRKNYAQKWMKRGVLNVQITCRQACKNIFELFMKLTYIV